MKNKEKYELVELQNKQRNVVIIYKKKCKTMSHQKD